MNDCACEASKSCRPDYVAWYRDRREAGLGASRAGEHMERRVVAIVVADMVGFSRLMERDETDVLSRQKTCFAEVFHPLFAEWRGRIVKGTGDGFIGVFDSVTDALECAVRIQRQMAKRETGPEEGRIVYRIAVNVGEAKFEEDDVFGDGVNVAARLEALAQPGGVVVSGGAYDLIKSQVKVGYQSLGAVKVKNISEAVRVFQVLDDPTKVGVTGYAVPWTKIASGATVLIVLLTVGWSWLARPDFVPADPARMEYRLPDTPSIAVTAFENLKDDSNDFLGRSMTEALIVKLTGAPTLTVVDATRTDGASEGSVAVIAEKTSARYVLSGSYLEAGGEIQISAKLADAIEGRQIWAKTYRRPSTAEAFFEIQEEITDSVASEVNIELSTSELFEAYRLEGGSLEDIEIGAEASEAFQSWDAGGNATAMRLYQILLDRHPDSAAANTLVAWAWWQQGVIGLASPADVFPKAAALANKALELDPTFAGAHAVLAWIALPMRDYDLAEEHVDAHISLSRGSPAASMTGALLAFGRLKEVEAAARRIMREQPRHHDFVPRNLATSLMRQGRYAEARSIYEGILASDLRDIRLKRQVRTDLVVLAHLEGDENARDAAMQELRKANPKLSIKMIGLGLFDRDGEWTSTYLGALREAGLPNV